MFTDDNKTKQFICGYSKLCRCHTTYAFLFRQVSEIVVFLFLLNGDRPYNKCAYLPVILDYHIEQGRFCNSVIFFSTIIYIRIYSSTNILKLTNIYHSTAKPRHTTSWKAQHTTRLQSLNQTKIPPWSTASTNFILNSSSFPILLLQPTTTYVHGGENHPSIQLSKNHLYIYISGSR